MGGCDGNPTEPMDGDLGGVDIMNGEEEAIDCKSFLFFFFLKKSNQKKGGRMEGYLLVAKKKKEREMEIYTLEVKKPK